MSTDNQLVYVEPLSVKVSRFLKEKGFQAANDHGVAIDSMVGSSSLGILYKDPIKKPKKYLWGLITGEEPRRIFLGVIYLGTNPITAGDNQWDLKMWGKEHFEVVKKLGEDLVKEFKTKIVLSVEDDSENEERILSNTDSGSVSDFSGYS